MLVLFFCNSNTWKIPVLSSSVSFLWIIRTCCSNDNSIESLKQKTVCHVIQLKTHHGTVENTLIFYHFERIKCCNLIKDKILPDMQEWNDAQAHAHFHKTPWITFHSFLFVWEEGKASTDYLLFNALYSLANAKFIFNLLVCSLWVFLPNKHEECGKKTNSVIFRW